MGDYIRPTFGFADDSEAAGPITPAEAREIADRFNASHWHGIGRPAEGERARYSIPANPKRDDDIRLHAFITQTEALRADMLALLKRVEWKGAGPPDYCSTCPACDADSDDAQSHDVACPLAAMIRRLEGA